MEKYHYILRFFDANQRLSAEDGLHINELAKLLTKLSAALNIKGNDKIVLSEIQDRSYAPRLTTSDPRIHSNLRIIHKKLNDAAYDKMTAEELEYAKQLKIVVDKGISIETYDKPSLQEKPSFKITEIEIPEIPEYYYQIGTCQGIVTSIGSVSMEAKSFIALNTTSFKIQVSESQENNLIQYFKKTPLRLKIEKKINFETNKISSAELLDFSPINDGSFLEEIDKLKTADVDLFSDVEDAVKSVRRLRE